jgi:hypothetical protein
MRKEISLFQFFISIILGVYALIMIIYFEINYFSYKQFLFMTMWNFYFSTIYLIIVAICDFSFFILKSDKLEKLNELFRETISPSLTALTYLVTFTFWVMIFPALILGGKDGNFGLSLYLNLYLHLYLTIFQTIDIFLSQRKYKGIIIKYEYLIAVFIMGVYSLLAIVLVYGFDMPIYPFLNNMTWYKAIGEIILFQIMTYLFYLIHVGLIKLKYKFKINVLDDIIKKIE